MSELLCELERGNEFNNSGRNEFPISQLVNSFPPDEGNTLIYLDGQLSFTSLCIFLLPFLLLLPPRFLFLESQHKNEISFKQPFDSIGAFESI